MRMWIISVLVLIPALTAMPDLKDSDTTSQILNLNSELDFNQALMISKSVDFYSKKYGIDQKIYLSIIKTESNFDQAAVSPTGDISLAQINVPVWNREFKRLHLPLINYQKLKHNSDYAVEVMSIILTIFKNRYASSDPQWFARYHSSTLRFKNIYLAKLSVHQELLAQAKMAIE